VSGAIYELVYEGGIGESGAIYELVYKKGQGERAGDRSGVLWGVWGPE
jgi:hypothetical protein